MYACMVFLYVCFLVSFDGCNMCFGPINFLTRFCHLKGLGDAERCSAIKFGEHRCFAAGAVGLVSY